jgi:hypothetical protein
VDKFFRAAAITACLLGIFWPVAQQALFWAGLNDFFGGDSWVTRAYFLDQYVAALVLGLVVAERWVVSVAAIGGLAYLVCTFGLRHTSAGTDTAYGSAWSAYLEAGLSYLWVAGLIALGIILSRRLGGLRVSPEREPHPSRPEAQKLGA